MSNSGIHIGIFITALAPALLFASCSADDAIQKTDGEPHPVMIGLQSRAGGAFSDVTYRACLFDESGALYSTGTYCDADPSVPELPWLTPCAINPDGSYAGKDANCGLYSRNGTYRLVLLSPAIAVPDDGRLLQTREAGTASLSAPLKISVQHSTANNFFSYTVPASAELYERRARLTVNVRCGESIAGMELNSVTLTDVTDKAYYDMLSQSFSTEGIASADAFRDIPLVTETVSMGYPEAEGRPVCVSAATLEPLFAMDYSAQKSDGSPLYRVPSLVLAMNGNTDEPVRIQLNIRMLPMNDYTVNVIVNTASLTVSVTPLPWQEVPALEDGEISNNDGFTIEVPVSGWTDGVQSGQNETTFN